MSEWSEKNSRKTSLSTPSPKEENVRYPYEVFGIKRSEFVVHFRKSSKKFIIEILTKNLALNLSAALFFIGLGYSLKWWYKDQLFHFLLKQNLPAFSEPQQKLSWETGDYLLTQIEKQHQQFVEKKINLPIPTLCSILETNSKNLPQNKISAEQGVLELETLPFGSVLFAKDPSLPIRSPLVAYPSEEAVAYPSVAKHVAYTPKGLTKLNERKPAQDLHTPCFARGVCNKGVYMKSEQIGNLPLASRMSTNKEVCNRKGSGVVVSPLFSIPFVDRDAKDMIQDTKFPLERQFARQLEVSYNLIDRIDFYTNQIVVKLKQPWQKHVYQRFVGIFVESNQIDKNNKIIKNSTATKLHNFSPTVLSKGQKLQNNCCQEQEKFLMYKPWKPLFSKTWFQLSARNLCFLTPEFSNSISSLVRYPEGKNRRVWNVLKPISLSSYLMLNYASHTPCFARGICNYLKTGRIGSLRESENQNNGILNTKFIKLCELISNNKKFKFNKNCNKSQTLYTLEKLSYPLELTKTLTGWQPSIDLLVLNSYLDEIPYKLENALQPYFPKNDSELLLLSTSFLKSIIPSFASSVYPFRDMQINTSKVIPLTPKGLAKQWACEAEKKPINCFAYPLRACVDAEEKQSQDLHIPEGICNKEIITVPHTPLAVSAKQIEETHHLHTPKGLAKQGVWLAKLNKEKQGVKLPFFGCAKQPLPVAFHQKMFGKEKNGANDQFLAKGACNKASAIHLKKLHLFEIKTLLQKELQFLINTLSLVIIDSFFPNEHLQRAPQHESSQYGVDQERSFKENTTLLSSSSSLYKGDSEKILFRNRKNVNQRSCIDTSCSSCDSEEKQGQDLYIPKEISTVPHTPLAVFPKDSNLHTKYAKKQGAYPSVAKHVAGLPLFENMKTEQIKDFLFEGKKQEMIEEEETKIKDKNVSTLEKNDIIDLTRKVLGVKTFRNLISNTDFNAQTQLKRGTPSSEFFSAAKQYFSGLNDIANRQPFGVSITENIFFTPTNIKAEIVTPKDISVRLLDRNDFQRKKERFASNDQKLVSDVKSFSSDTNEKVALYQTQIPNNKTFISSDAFLKKETPSTNTENPFSNDNLKEEKITSGPKEIYTFPILPSLLSESFFSCSKKGLISHFDKNSFASFPFEEKDANRRWQSSGKSTKKDKILDVKVANEIFDATQTFVKNQEQLPLSILDDKVKPLIYNSQEICYPLLLVNNLGFNFNNFSPVTNPTILLPTSTNSSFGLRTPTEIRLWQQLLSAKLISHFVNKTFQNLAVLPKYSNPFGLLRTTERAPFHILPDLKDPKVLCISHPYIYTSCALLHASQPKDKPFGLHTPISYASPKGLAKQSTIEKKKPKERKQPFLFVKRAIVESPLCFFSVDKKATKERGIWVVLHKMQSLFCNSNVDLYAIWLPQRGIPNKNHPKNYVDTLFQFNQNHLTWEIFQHPKQKFYKNYKIKGQNNNSYPFLLPDLRDCFAYVNSKETSLRGKSTPEVATYRKGNYARKRIKFKQKKTTITTLDKINLVDKRVNFANTKSRCMSGYVYPDIQSDLLKNFLLRIIPSKFTFGIPKEKLAFMQLLDKACLANIKIPIPPTTFLAKHGHFLSQQLLSFFEQIENTQSLYPFQIRNQNSSGYFSLAATKAPKRFASATIENFHAIFLKNKSFPYYKFNHYLAKFPGVIEKNCFTPDIFNINRKNEFSNKEIKKFFVNSNRRKIAYNGIVVQRNNLTKDFQPFTKFMEKSSIWGTRFLGAENPFTDRQCHFFGQKQLSTLDTNSLQRDYLRQLGKEILVQSNSKGFTELSKFSSIERTKILSFSKKVNSFVFKKRKYSYLLQPNDQWHLLFQEQLRTALENCRKYPLLHTEGSKETKSDGTGLIKVSAPLIMARFPKEITKYPLLDKKQRPIHSLNDARINLYTKDSILPQDRKDENGYFSSFLSRGKTGSIKSKILEPNLKHGVSWRPSCFLDSSYLVMPRLLPNKLFNLLVASPYNHKYPSSKKIIFENPVKQPSLLEDLRIDSMQNYDGIKIRQHYSFFSEKFCLDNTPWLNNKNKRSQDFSNFSSFTPCLARPFRACEAVGYALHSIIHEPLHIHFWAVLNQWIFLLALLIWIEQILLDNVLPSLFALEQILLGVTGIKTGDRTHIIRISKNKTPKFQNLAGIDGLLGELSELVLFLRSQQKIGERFWNKKNSYGVLLTGPPGTGKTFLVRALANEANIPVLILSASTLVANKFNSNKPSWSIRHAFRRAKQLSPCILFIDEIDVLGKSRGKIVTDINEIITEASLDNYQNPYGEFSTAPDKIVSSSIFSYEQFGQNWPSVSNLLLNKWENPIKSTLFQEFNEINQNSLCKEKLFYLLKENMERESTSNTWLDSSSCTGYGSASQDNPASSGTNLLNKITPQKSTKLNLHGKRPIQDFEEKKDEMFLNSTEFGENNKRKFGPLTQLLVSMDGVNSFSGVLIMGATNRPELLDPALIRPGRFEKIIRIDKPSEQNRIEILQLYSHNLGVQDEIPWSYLANRTRGLTTADLAVAMNYSSLKAISEGSTHTIETIEYGLNSIAR